MKFAKELDRDLVPEWRGKYLNYKAGKKYVKAVARAVHRANGTPYVGRRGDMPPHTPSIATGPGRRLQNIRMDGEQINESSPLRKSPAPLGRVGAAATPPQPITDGGRRGALANASDDQNQMQYGSFVPTPPSPSPISTPTARNTFELPAPAMRVPSRTSDTAPRPALTLRRSVGRLALRRSVSTQEGGTQQRRAPDGTPDPKDTPVPPRERLERLLSTGSHLGRRPTAVNIGMDNLNEVRDRERELFAFLDSELDKIETFYKQKEDQAGKRLAELREQLHEMRNRRIEEIAESKRRKEQANGYISHEGGPDGGNGIGVGIGKSISTSWLPIKDKLFKPGPNSKALERMPRTPVMAAGYRAPENRDHIRRPAEQDVPYRTAKRKLKLALQEFYRGLELLKSYALLNQTAFRKLNKKYDKAVNVRPLYRYMNEKVSKTWFVNSDVLDNYINVVEDLYARYFEKGNHKVAAGKLRSFTKRADQSSSSFRSGLLVGIGAVFSVQGLALGADLLLHSQDPVMRVQTAYLLQIYAGYFLMLYLFSLFCLVCRIWTLNKINYPFIFEFDVRDHLNWREMMEFPSFFLLLFGLFMWLNFSQYGSPDMYLYYPVILIGVSVVVLFFPAPILRYTSRRWFLHAHWRVFFAGLYPVEFRDFFLGDIYCSLVYSLSNIALFFCLYATYWANPGNCNSGHSRLLGFFTTLPGIWRALQCVRRYYDTRNVFPHLVNCGKYTMTTLYYVTLSLYRIENTHTNLALFITFSTINAVYTSLWDILMDLSLLQTHSRNRLLRDVLAFRQKWPYYSVMVLDPCLRFSWIFYAIFTHNTQHSSLCSFLIGFFEATRRGMWALFRVENEHCTNVAAYRASRDVPLPYQLEQPLEEQGPNLEPAAVAGEGTGGPLEADEARAAVAGMSPQSSAAAAAAGRSTGVDISSSRQRAEDKDSKPSPAPPTPGAAEQGGVPPEFEGTVRRRRQDTIGRKSIAKIMADAHRQDFEKKRKPNAEAAGKSSRDAAGAADGALRADGEDDDDDDDDDDDEDTGSMLEERMEVREAEGFVGGVLKGSDTE